MAGKQPPSPGRETSPWDAVAASPLLSAYVGELYWLARDTRDTCTTVFREAVGPEGGNESYIGVDHPLMGAIFRVLNNAARIRALVNERPRRKSTQSAKQYALQQSRTRWLRQLLEAIDLSETLHARVRNSLEHFDEFLDDTALKFIGKTTGWPVLLPFDTTVWLPETFEQLARGGTVYPLRVYVARDRTFLNCGLSINLSKLADEAEAIIQRLETTAAGLVPRGEDGERGSSLIVLTERTFKAPPGSA